jgi:hypothetical protein
MRTRAAAERSAGRRRCGPASRTAPRASRAATIRGQAGATRRGRCRSGRRLAVRIGSLRTTLRRLYTTTIDVREATGGVRRGPERQSGLAVCGGGAESGRRRCVAFLSCAKAAVRVRRAWAGHPVSCAASTVRMVRLKLLRARWPPRYCLLTRSMTRFNATPNKLFQRLNAFYGSKVPSRNLRAPQL